MIKPNAQHMRRAEAVKNFAGELFLIKDRVYGIKAANGNLIPVASLPEHARKTLMAFWQTVRTERNGLRVGCKDNSLSFETFQK